MAEEEGEKIGSFYMRQKEGATETRLVSAGKLAALALFAFAGLLWYTYPRNEPGTAAVDIPVIEADSTPIKTLPSDPGGMDVPHQDSTIFEQMERAPAASVEKLMPLAEEPVKKTETPAEPILKKPDTTPAKTVSKKQLAAKQTEIVYIQLGAFREAALASTEWQRLQKKYPEVLKGFTMRTVRAAIPGKGVFYRLQAGTADAGTKAQDTCVKIKPAACTIVKEGK